MVVGFHVVNIEGGGSNRVELGIGLGLLGIAVQWGRLEEVFHEVLTRLGLLLLLQFGGFGVDWLEDLVEVGLVGRGRG